MSVTVARRRGSKIPKNFPDVIPAWPFASLNSRVRREVVDLNFEGEQVDWTSEKVLSQMPHFTILAFFLLMKGSLDYPSGILIGSTSTMYHGFTVHDYIWSFAQRTTSFSLLLLRKMDGNDGRRKWCHCHPDFEAEAWLEQDAAKSWTWETS